MPGDKLLTVIVNSTVAAALLLLAVTKYEAESLVSVGFPEITPVAESNWIPWGRVGLTV